jgi:hypothetical protein
MKKLAASVLCLAFMSGFLLTPQAAEANSFVKVCKDVKGIQKCSIVRDKKAAAGCIRPKPTPQNNYNKGGCCIQTGSGPHGYTWQAVCSL